jgi:hypothetical protein
MLYATVRYDKIKGVANKPEFSNLMIWVYISSKKMIVYSSLSDKKKSSW